VQLEASNRKKSVPLGGLAGSVNKNPRNEKINDHDQV
jgi:hypothetical protein